MGMKQQLRLVLSALIMGLILVLVIKYLPYLLAGAFVTMSLLMLSGLIIWFWFRHRVRGLSDLLEQQLKQSASFRSGGHSEHIDQGQAAPFGDVPPRRTQQQGPVIHIRPQEVIRTQTPKSEPRAESPRAQDQF
ncbi:MAG: hypothetical protein CVV27_01615 [Candidatus Melainabacteria bacterium HGW-Melainabacteria-1]|nr:MAG: hypothetical protein CVV27_01615 [Candidatus Melainabacteria bacterium HGW-Melainabacteria-1]